MKDKQPIKITSINKDSILDIFVVADIKSTNKYEHPIRIIGLKVKLTLNSSEELKLDNLNNTKIPNKMLKILPRPMSS
tara:strand:- start:442 stop:675 length:234 start_codon:yes stop_codon:yes gene_type:complete